jgi:DNA-binding transcriptional regulator YdaS (Cro superfamily)
VRHSKIIDDLAAILGSQAKLARRIGVDDTQVCKWKDRGIPARYWPHIVAVARARRYPLTIKDVVEGSPLPLAKPRAA